MCCGRSVRSATWPSELDLMAEIACPRLREHWGGWEQEPIEPTRWCISAYERAGACGVDARSPATLPSD
jgi:hypothetical protein